MPTTDQRFPLDGPLPGSDLTTVHAAVLGAVGESVIITDLQGRIRNEINSDGFSPAEGAAFLLLARAATAQAHGLQPLASVLGAGYSGAKAATATSGPGLSLMSELIGLAGTAEIPSVIVTTAAPLVPRIDCTFTAAHTP